MFQERNYRISVLEVKWQETDRGERVANKSYQVVTINSGLGDMLMKVILSLYLNIIEESGYICQVNGAISKVELQPFASFSSVGFTSCSCVCAVRIGLCGVCVCTSGCIVCVCGTLCVYACMCV